MNIIKTNSKNQILLDGVFNTTQNQSAGNLTGSSETIRKLSNDEIEWLAGVLDGDGNFDIRYDGPAPKERILKQIRITQHPRDARLLYQVKKLLGGSIKSKGKKYLLWSISTKSLMINCLNLINGHIRLKVPGFKEACVLFNINYRQANYKILENSAYLAGLIDTDGSVVWNYTGNRIDLFLEFQQNEYSDKLDISTTIPGAHVKVYNFVKRNQTRDKIFYSKRFAYQSLDNLLPLYNYFKNHRLYNDFKFYRVMQIKRFLELRPFCNYPVESAEFKLYYNFALAWFTHMNLDKPLPIFFMNRNPKSTPVDDPDHIKR